MTSLVTLRHVGMRYRRRAAAGEDAYAVFDDINLKLHRGERLGVVGRNGAGKSTLLRIMAKIFAPFSGEVIWTPDTKVSLLSLGLGFRPDLTGQENAMLSCLLQGLPKKEASRALGEIETFCELGAFFAEPVRTYSTGMRARLGFATALANRSDVILIDETLGVGDAAFREKAQDALQGQLTEDRAVVIVSHAPGQIRALCGRAIWLGEGGLQAEGDPADVLAQYNAALA